jgi:hypothetical protein
MDGRLMRRALLNNVSCRVLVWSLAKQTGLTSSLDRVRFRASKVRSGAVKWTVCVTPSTSTASVLWRENCGPSCS